MPRSIYYFDEKEVYLILFVSIAPSLLSAAHADDISRQTSSQSIVQSTTSVQDLGLLFNKEVREQFCKKYGVVRSIALNAIARARYAARTGQRVSLPAAVKNWEYFPKFGSQGQRGSCAAFSTCYYYKTFQEARDHGWVRPDPDANPEHSMSAAFIYNMSNGGIGSGTYIETNIELVVENGCATQQDMPYHDYDYTIWPLSSVWKHAIAYRAETATTIDLSTDAGLAALKQHLANEDLQMKILQSQVFMCTTIFIIIRWMDVKRTTMCFMMMEVHILDLGGHAVTLIGYDDTKAYNDGTGTIWCISAGEFIGLMGVF